MLFKISVAIWIFYLAYITIDGRQLLKFSILIVLLLISPFISVNICFNYMDDLLSGVCMLSEIISSYEDPFTLSNDFLFFCLLNGFYLKVYFV